MPGRLYNKRNKTTLYIDKYTTCISFYLFNFYYTLFGDLPFANTEWSRRPDSNRGPTVYKTVALPLSYAGRYILFAKNSFANIGYYFNYFLFILSSGSKPTITPNKIMSIISMKLLY
jgi:hypothetical protein